MMQSALLPDRAVLAVQGEDAHSYLQGLITNDIMKVTPGKAIFSALLSPQGKYLFEFFITEHEGVLLFETDKARLPELIKRLTMYRLRAKVTFEERMDLQVGAVWGGNQIPESIAAYADTRHPELGYRFLYSVIPAKAGILATPPAFAGVKSEEGEYDTHRLSLGIPEGGKDLIVDRSILLEFGYDHLNAIDFHKGCYVGQEVTARSKHRATLHKYIHCVSAETTLPPSGTPVTNDGRELGEMRSSSGKLGLAVLRTADAALSQHMVAGDVPIYAQLPRWIAS